jgi:hypothetical protein
MTRVAYLYALFRCCTQFISASLSERRDRFEAAAPPAGKTSLNQRLLGESCIAAGNGARGFLSLNMKTIDMVILRGATPSVILLCSIQPESKRDCNGYN